MMLIEHHAIKAYLIGISQLINILLIQTTGLLPIPQTIGDSDPARGLGVVKIRRQMGIGHEVPAIELNRATHPQISSLMF